MSRTYRIKKDLKIKKKKFKEDHRDFSGSNLRIENEIAIRRLRKERRKLPEEKEFSDAED